MPRNGTGSYALPAGNPVVTGTTISSSTQNSTMSDVASALTQSLSKDGQTVATANLPMGGFKHTGVADGSATTDYASYGQLTTGAVTMTNKTLTAPVLGGTVTGTYTLGGTPTLTSPTINTPTINTPTIAGGTINNASVGATTPLTGAFTTLSYSGTLTGGTGVIAIGTNQIYKDASGNVGIGTASPADRLHVTKGAADVARFTNSLTNGGDWELKIGGGGFEDRKLMITDKYSGADNVRVAIDSSGNLLVGTTTANVGIGDLTTATGAGFNPIGFVGATRASEAAAYFTRTGSDGRIVNFYKGSSGVGGISVTTTATSFNTSSDYRLKENVAPMQGALATVATLNPVTYTWKANGEDGQGFIAHELAEVVPECVSGEKDATQIQQYEISPAVPATFDEEGNELTPAIEAVMGKREVPVYQGIDTSFLVATLTAAIQELKAMVDAQAVEIAALKAQSI